jgi:hypothetical protein
MKFAKWMLIVAGVLGLMGILALAIAPKAAHAIVATMVQVVNTPTTAIPAVQAPSAGKLYVNTCSVLFEGTSTGICFLPVIPAGETLFVEAVSFSMSGGDPIQTELFANGFVGNPVAFIPLTQQASSIVDNWTGALGARLSLAGPGTPGCFMALSRASTGGFSCAVSGYMAPAN